MKKNLSFLLLLILTGLLFYGCADDSPDVPMTEVENDKGLSQQLKGIKDPEVRKAIMWYEENQKEVASARSSSGGHPLFEGMLPKWRYAFSRSSGEDRKTVDVPLDALTSTLYTFAENVAAYESTGNRSYLRSQTRLIILTDTPGKTRGFFMTTVPSKKYIDRVKYRVFRSTYLERDPDFDGDILFHELNGKFSNGWRYKDGKITHRLDKEKASLSRGHYEVIEHCYDVYKDYCTGRYITDEYGNQVLVETHCESKYMGQECYTETIWVPGPGGGEVDPDPKPKCQFKTPGCKGGNDCTCCATCKGPCIAPACPFCGKKHCAGIHDDCKFFDDAVKALSNELFNALGGITTNGAETITFNTFLQNVSSGNDLEHSVALNPKGSSHILTYYEKGSKTDVTTYYDQTTRAIIHTHPNSTTPGMINLLPPSAKDVSNFLVAVTEKNSTGGYQNPALLNSYVIADGYTFALTVTDRDKASAFFSGNPGFVDSSNSDFLKTTGIGEAYDNAVDKLKDKYSGTELDTYALAHALEHVGTGIQVLWKKGNESAFTALKVVDKDGTIFIVKCK